MNESQKLEFEVKIRNFINDMRARVDTLLFYQKGTKNMDLAMSQAWLAIADDVKKEMEPIKKVEE